MKSYKTFFRSTTLLITLKDNSNFTKKLIKYLNLQSIKIEILVADGSKKKQKNLFKKLKHRYRYYYYGEDKNLSDYYLKIYKSLKQIKSKFVFFSDQDDFINFNILKKKEIFLAKNTNFSAAKGILYNFQNYKKNLLILDGKSYPKERKNKKNLFNRILFNFHFRSYYCLHRKKNLIKIFKIVIHNKISDVRSAEFVMDFSTLLFGEIYFINQCSLLRWSGNKYGLHPIKKHDNSRFSWYFNKIFKNNILLKDIISINNNFNLNLVILKVIIIFFDMIPLAFRKIIDFFLKIIKFKKNIESKIFKDNEINKIFKILNDKLLSYGK